MKERPSQKRRSQEKESRKKPQRKRARNCKIRVLEKSKMQVNRKKDKESTYRQRKANTQSGKETGINDRIRMGDGFEGITPKRLNSKSVGPTINNHVDAH